MNWRQSSGMRAMRRREALGLTVERVAAGVGVSPPLLMRWEEGRLPTQLSSDVVDSWERSLEVPAGWLVSVDSVDRQIEKERALIRIDEATVAEAIEKVAHLLASEGRGREACIKRDVEIFVRRYGVRGPQLTTLEAIGDHFGLTRERVRQILRRMSRLAQQYQFDVPVVIAVRNRCIPLLPGSVEEVSQKLNRWIGGSLSLSDAHRFVAEILDGAFLRIIKSADGPARWRVAVLGGGVGEDSEYRALIVQIHRAMRVSGAAHMATILSGGGDRLNKGGLQRWIELAKNFEWLDRELGWFWFRGSSRSQNMTILVAEKMFCVAQTALGAVDVVQGMMRYAKKGAWRLRDQTSGVASGIPPVAVVDAILRRLPWLKAVPGNRYCLCRKLDPACVLSLTERKMLEVGQRLQGVVGRAELSERLVAEGGVLFDAFAATIATTPIWVRIDRGVYALSGWPVSASARARALLVVGRGTDRAFHETKNCATFPFVLTAYAIKTKVCHIPAIIATRIPAGNYRIDGSTARVVCVHRRSGSSVMAGMVDALISAGLLLGTRVRLHVNIPERLIKLQAL
ncbi:helix-turn-helix domain-containing protein [Burkholderia cenocepacia]|uniref:helix-turn-helix domain-containing protein n=1 Tax=Burkholderia cenocepacia TaxID=95486 RepID=UPI000F5ADFC0|nr:helix-turn-helix domain-containing protein [Burkholderia cenocepacia]